MARDSRTFKFKFTGDVKGLKGATGEAAKDLDGFDSKIAKNAKRIAGAMAAAFAVEKIWDWGNALLKVGETADLMAAKSAVVFGDQLDSVTKWADESAGAMGLTSTELTGLAANMADLLIPMGATRDEASDMSTDMNDLAGALSMWSGGTRSAAEVSEILSKALLGERDALTSLGIKINQAEVDQRALAVAQADGREEVTQLDKALATQALILEKSADAQAAWTDGTFEGSIKANELSAKVKELKESLGLLLLPAVDAVRAFLVDKLIPAFEEFGQWMWPKLAAAHKALTGWWDANGPAIVGFVVSVKDAAIELGQGFASMWNDHIGPALSELGGALSDLWNSVRSIFGDINVETEGSGVNWEKLGRIVARIVQGIILVIASMVTAVDGMAKAVSDAVAVGQREFNRLRDGVGSLFDKLQELYDLFGRVKDRLAGGLSIPTPSWPTPPSWMTRWLPNNHAGAMTVPGAAGANVPTMLQAGERVLSVAQTRQTDRGGGGGGQTIVVNAYGATGREMVAEIERAVRDGARAGWLTAAGVA